MKTRIYRATPNKNIPGGWKKGKEYSVLVSPLDTRICIYKDNGNYREQSGYKVYENLEALEQDFKTEILMLED